MGACLGAIAALAGCADDGKDEQNDSASEKAQPFEAQAARGMQLYAEHCATCHGDNGEGQEGPRLVGLDQGALPEQPRAGSMRTNEFVTVADVAEFVVKAMPPTDPGSLSNDEYLAILAFDLKANGIALEQELDLELAKTLTIPR
jgi:cytochrome c